MSVARMNSVVCRSQLVCNGHNVHGQPRRFLSPKVRADSVCGCKSTRFPRLATRASFKDRNAPELSRLRKVHRSQSCFEADLHCSVSILVFSYLVTAFQVIQEAASALEELSEEDDAQRQKTNAPSDLWLVLIPLKPWLILVDGQERLLLQDLQGR